eukprot:CAMPEP_0119125298 /NCGR_PEP_ID=MMETSP1310-20130426/4622_1 /TAXON_ID=464262 /ORGANISM="Genus nov. species nov., Strain RCC2339" /LENGTH=474 /DNA_ID=CAMNT_0007115349 /DNA_START=183 /DNA_END=1603 /DNA_ORIENTATION=-
MGKEKSEAAGRNRSDSFAEPTEKDLPWVNYKIFKSRNSIFDIHANEDGFHNNQLRGFFHLAGMMFIFYIVSQNILEIRETGTVAGAENLIWIYGGLIKIVPHFILMVAGTFWAPLIQMGFNAGMPVWSYIFLRVLLNAAVFFGSCYTIVTHRDVWPISQISFFMLEMFVLSLKIYSYFDVNWYLQIERDQKVAKGEKIPTNDPSVYPNNLTLWNWFMFLNFPTLVYTTKYPRTKRIRPLYIVEKFFSAVVTFSFMHVLIAEKVQPIWTRPDQYDALEAIIQLFLPVTMLYLAAFYIVFEVILNAFAELTMYGDREFYEDWWNSTTWDEFARKWNKQVHVWARCHCYLPLIQRRRLSRTMAGIITFFISSLVHELAFYLIFGMLRPWMFTLQMAQIPLIFLGQALKNTLLGNVVFWFGLCFGPPLISILYTREFYSYKLGIISHPFEYFGTVLPVFSVLVFAGFALTVSYFLISS